MSDHKIIESTYIFCRSALNKSNFTNLAIGNLIKKICIQENINYKKEKCSLVLLNKDYFTLTKYLTDINFFYSNPELYISISKASHLLEYNKHSLIAILKKETKYLYVPEGNNVTIYVEYKKIYEYYRFIKDSTTITEVLRDIGYQNNQHRTSLIYKYTKNAFKCKLSGYYRIPTNEVSNVKKKIILYYKELNSGEYEALKDYYCLNEIREKYKVKWRIPALKLHISDFKYHMHKIYFRKDEIDFIVSDFKNSILIKDIVKEQNTTRDTLMKLLKKLNIEYTAYNETPYGIGYISKTSYISLCEIIKETNSERGYLKLKNDINSCNTNEHILITIEHFKQFAINRFNKVKKKSDMYTTLKKTFNEYILSLEKELFCYSNEEIIKLISKETYSRRCDEEILFFLTYIKKHHISNYDIELKYTGRRRGKSITYRKEPYSEELWLAFGKLIFTGIADDALVKNAIDSWSGGQNWLYSSFLFVCAWRKTDIISSIPILKLKDIIGVEDEKFIDWIQSGNIFTEEMGIKICDAIVKTVRGYDLRHQKNNEKLYLIINSCYARTIGLLYCIVSSKRYLYIKLGGSYYNTKSLFSNNVGTIDGLENIFGDDIRMIFEKHPFSIISANKTYLQMIEKDTNNGNWGLGYYIASVSRGHKLNGSNLSETTKIYLQETHKQESLNEISYNLYIRKPLSFIPYMIYEMIDPEFKMKTHLEITEYFEEFDMLTPKKGEIISELILGNKEKGKMMIDELISSNDKSLEQILLNISKGEYSSKMNYSQCLFKVIELRGCINKETSNCLGCCYFLPDLLFLFELNDLIKSAFLALKKCIYKFDQDRYIHLITEVYMDIIYCACSIIGKEQVDSIINLDLLKSDLNNALLFSNRSERTNGY